MKMASLIVGIFIALVAAMPAQARKGGDDSSRAARSEERGPDDRSASRRGRQDGGPWQEEDGRGRGRLTPEERRDLRRDIRDAGRDIYPDLRRRFRD